MKRRVDERDWLPLSGKARAIEIAPTGEAFKPEWIDFERGIRVGNLEPHERITRILKYHLEQQYGTPFITDRWGRGVYWQWICWLPRANREAKPVSAKLNFGCAKFFISADRVNRVLQAGLQIERGYARAEPRRDGTPPPWVLARDWDWHKLMKGCAAGTALDAELRRLVVKEGFCVKLEGAPRTRVFAAGVFPSAAALKTAAANCAKDQWAGFQVFYPMPASEVASCSGYDLVKAILSAFREVLPVMNLCMDVPLKAPAH